jgi:hypothetical protein
MQARNSNIEAYSQTLNSWAMITQKNMYLPSFTIFQSSGLCTCSKIATIAQAIAYDARKTAKHHKEVYVTARE